MSQSEHMTQLAETDEEATKRMKHPLAEPEPSIDELTRAAATGRGTRPDPATDHARVDHDDDEDDEGGLLELVFDYRYYIIGGIVALIGAFVISTMLLSGPSPSESSNQPQKADPKPTAQAAPALDARNTGIVIEEPVEENGEYFLRVGEIAWKGELKDTDTGQELTLTGPTSAQFKRAVTLPSGAITTGVFGRAETGQPIVHATFHRTETSGEETTSGTYYALDDDVVLVQGTYIDTRDGDTITRVYEESAPGSNEETRYAVTFDSPMGIPIPALVGWKSPAPVDDAQNGDGA